MILFKPEHVDPILTGRKTQTRRLGKKRWNVGSIHACYTRPPFARGGAEPFCRVLILGVRRERLDDISEGDARAEGYPNSERFVEAFERINRTALNPETCEYPRVWVVTFEVTP